MTTPMLLRTSKMPRRGVPQACGIFPWAVVALLWAAPFLASMGTAAAQISFTAEVGGEMRTATLSPVESDEGITYVSLDALVRQLGGEVRSAEGRTQVDLGGVSARMGVGERAVESSSDSFSLQQPLARVGEEPYIALVDISSFFFRGFEMFVSRYESAEAPANAPLVESVPILEPLTPVEELEPSSSAEDSASPLEPDLLTPIGETAPPELEPAVPEESVVAEAAAPDERADNPVDDRSMPPALRAASTIVLDPGHGGYDTGAVGTQGVTEKEITLAVVTEVGRILKAETSLTIYLTRQEDKELTTPERVVIANEVTGDLLVSVHVGAARGPAGSGPATSVRGCSVFYWGPPEAASSRTARYTASSRALAESIAQALPAAMNDAWPANNPRAVPLRLLGDVRMPGVLIEAGYITTPEDLALLASESGRQRLARGIADGIKRALGTGARS